jgi:hypothetical protein
MPSPFGVIPPHSVDVAGKVEEEVQYGENVRRPTLDITGTQSNPRPDIVADMKGATPEGILDLDEGVAHVGVRTSGSSRPRTGPRTPTNTTAKKRLHFMSTIPHDFCSTRAICWTAFVVSGPRWVGGLMETTAGCESA